MIANSTSALTRLCLHLRSLGGFLLNVLSLNPIRRVAARWLMVALALLSSEAIVAAQLPTRLSDAAQVSLITTAPGDSVSNLFGHTAVRFVDPTRGFDVSFNYGVFEFGPGFVTKFLFGELDYMLGIFPHESSLEMSNSQNRTTVEQVFDLTIEQRQELYSALLTKAQPENRTYRYDFLFDNCSTRVIDIFEAVLGDGLVMPDGPYEPRTFRTLLDEHILSMPWLKLGFSLLLGSRLDREASIEESWFLPRHLKAGFDGATLDGKPLVTETRVLFDSGHGDVPAAVFDYAVAFCWALLILAVVFVSKDKRGGWSRTFDALLFATVGAAGCFLAFMWGATEHTVMGDNWNLGWALPTHLLAAIFLARRSRPTWLRIYFALTALSALMFAAGFGIPQELSPAILPVGLLIALRAAIHARPTPLASSKTG